MTELHIWVDGSATLDGENTSAIQVATNLIHRENFLLIKSLVFKMSHCMINWWTCFKKQGQEPIRIIQIMLFDN